MRCGGRWVFAGLAVVLGASVAVSVCGPVEVSITNASEYVLRDATIIGRYDEWSIGTLGPRMHATIRICPKGEEHLRLSFEVEGVGTVRSELGYGECSPLMDDLLRFVVLPDLTTVSVVTSRSISSEAPTTAAGR